MDEIRYGDMITVRHHGRGEFRAIVCEEPEGRHVDAIELLHPLTGEPFFTTGRKPPWGVRSVVTRRSVPLVCVVGCEHRYPRVAA